MNRFVMGFLAAFGAASGCFPAPANVVSDWDDKASSAIVDGARKGPASACAYLAYVTVAMYDIVASIDGKFRPFSVSVTAPKGASEDAAATVATYEVLVHYFPLQQTSLDAEEISSLSVVRDGQSRDDGVKVGRAVAEGWIATRADDALEARVPYVQGHGPGIWEPVPNVPAPGAVMTPPPVEPWFASFRRFALSSPEQFFSVLERPYVLESAEWAADFNLTKDHGAPKSAVRMVRQTETGLFWTDPCAAQYMRTIRGLIGTARAARLSAMAFVTLAEAFPASVSAKHTFRFWRHYTAIRNATETHISAATTPDVLAYLGGGATKEGEGAGFTPGTGVENPDAYASSRAISPEVLAYLGREAAAAAAGQ